MIKKCFVTFYYKIFHITNAAWLSNRSYYKMFGLFHQRSKLLFTFVKLFKVKYYVKIKFKKNIEKKLRLSLYGFYVKGFPCDIMKKTKSC